MAEEVENRKLINTVGGESLEEEGEIEIEEAEEGEIVDDSVPSEVLPQPHHPLEQSWTFWFNKPSGKNKQATWDSSILPIHTFSTVEDFWGLYNNINRPSKLAQGADFNCFKYKIEPKWEDPICANGGKWTILCNRAKSDTMWLYTLLALIGEQFDYGDEICGAVVNIRPKQDKISIWTKNASNATAQISIGRQWKELLDYNDTIQFIVHEDAMKLDRNAKPRHTV